MRLAEHKYLNAAARGGIPDATYHPSQIPADALNGFRTIPRPRLRGEIERDAAQEAIAARLTRLEERLAQLRLSRKSSHLGWLFAKSSPPEPIKGLYIHGDVGRGKTMLWTCSSRRAP